MKVGADWHFTGELADGHVRGGAARVHEERARHTAEQDRCAVHQAGHGRCPPELSRALTLDPGDVHLGKRPRLRAPPPPRHRDACHPSLVHAQEVAPRAPVPHEAHRERPASAAKKLFVRSGCKQRKVQLPR